jgi:hypothetical protein
MLRGRHSAHKDSGDKTVKRKLLSILVMVATAHVGAQVTDAMISNDAATTNNVLSWGMGTQGQRHSPLSDVNPNRLGHKPVISILSSVRANVPRPGIHGTVSPALFALVQPHPPAKTDWEHSIGSSSGKLLSATRQLGRPGSLNFKQPAVGIPGGRRSLAGKQVTYYGGGGDRCGGGGFGGGSYALRPQELPRSGRTAIAKCKLSPDCHQHKQQKSPLSIR